MTESAAPAAVAPAAAPQAAASGAPATLLTGAAPAAPASPATTAAAAPAAEPVKYEFKLPETSTLDAEDLKGIEAFARENGLSPAAAQKFAEREAAREAEMIGGMKAEMESLSTAWLKSVEADKDLGGANLKVTTENAQRAMAQLATPALRQYLADSRLGNHPELVRLFARIGSMIREDGVISSVTSDGAAKATALDIYPSSKSP